MKLLLVVLAFFGLIWLFYPKPVDNPSRCLGYVLKKSHFGPLGIDDAGRIYGEGLFTYSCIGLPFP